MSPFIKLSTGTEECRLVGSTRDNFRIAGFGHFLGEIKDGELHIGQTTVPVYNPENKTKVPDVLFYENHQVRTVQSSVSFGICLWTI